jgi:hypothetical protein
LGCDQRPVCLKQIAVESNTDDAAVQLGRFAIG